jgi:hypothetical protein
LNEPPSIESCASADCSISAPITFQPITIEVDDLILLFTGWQGRFQQVSAGKF